MNQVQVVAAVIRRSSKFLLGKRSPNKKSAPGYWSPISGKIEIGESESEAAERECFEEVGLVVKAIRKVGEFDIDDGQARLHWWLVEETEGKEFLKNNEHTELRWFTIEEMQKESAIFKEDIAIFMNLNPS